MIVLPLRNDRRFGLEEGLRRELILLDHYLNAHQTRLIAWRRKRSTHMRGLGALNGAPMIPYFGPQYDVGRLTHAIRGSLSVLARGRRVICGESQAGFWGINLALEDCA